MSVPTIKEIESAIVTGHKASEVLREVAEELYLEKYCNRAEIPGCGHCVLCVIHEYFVNDL